MAEKSNLPATIDTANTDEFTAALMAAGFLNPAVGGTDFHRIKMSGATLMYNDEPIASYNLKSKEPCLYIQLAGPPEEYQAMWFEQPLAIAVGRPEIAGKFCRSYFDKPDQARQRSETGYDCNACPVHPFMPADRLPQEAKEQQGASKCAWKGDIEFQIVERQPDGSFTKNDETLYTLTLPTTGIIEFKGSSSRKSNPLEGSVSPLNFMAQLGKFAIEKWGKEGLLKAHTALAMGGVIAAVRLPMAHSQDNSRTYHVFSLEPVEILEVEDRPALESGDTGTVEDDAVPF